MGVASDRVRYNTIDRFPVMLTVVKRPKTTVASKPHVPPHGLLAERQVKFFKVFILACHNKRSEG